VIKKANGQKAGTVKRRGTRRAMQLPKSIRRMFSPTVIGLAKKIKTDIKDPRSPKRVVYSLYEILLLVLIAGLCGCTEFVEMGDFIYYNRKWLSKFINLKKGIPSHDTLNRVFRMMEPQELAKLLQITLNFSKKFLLGKQICIDGKTIKGTIGKGMKCRFDNVVHMVNIFDNDNQMVVGMFKSNSKLSEYDVVLNEALDCLNITGRIISFDAASTYKEIIEKIVKKGGYYIAPVKRNQKNLFFRLSRTFKKWEHQILTTEDNAHGREEKRIYEIIKLTPKLLEEIDPDKKWSNLTQIVKVTTTVKQKSTNKRSRASIRYYITNHAQGYKPITKWIRNHWGIENKLHWSLDVSMGEDDCQVRRDNAPANLSILRDIILNLLRKDPTKLSIKRKMNLALHQVEYIIRLLEGDFSTEYLYRQ
jgi:predicted transposase YbfD/YdcC